MRHCLACGAVHLKKEEPIVAPVHLAAAVAAVVLLAVGGYWLKTNSKVEAPPGPGVDGVAPGLGILRRPI